MCTPVLKHEGRSAPSDIQAHKQRPPFYGVEGLVLIFMAVKECRLCSLPGSGGNGLERSARWVLARLDK